MQTLDQLLQQLHIEDDKWDALLVGDGSGTTWQRECGWGCVLITPYFERVLLHGSLSHGTNNVAEMMAYVHGLMYLNSGDSPLQIEAGSIVHIITDSQYVVSGLKHNYPPRGNFELWAALQASRRFGLVVQAHWVPRDTIDLNRLTHDVANLARVRQKGLAEQALGKRGLHDFNPYRR